MIICYKNTTVKSPNWNVTEHLYVAKNGISQIKRNFEVWTENEWYKKGEGIFINMRILICLFLMLGSFVIQL